MKVYIDADNHDSRSKFKIVTSEDIITLSNLPLPKKSLIILLMKEKKNILLKRNYGFDHGIETCNDQFE